MSSKIPSFCFGDGKLRTFSASGAAVGSGEGRGGKIAPMFEGQVRKREITGNHGENKWFGADSDFENFARAFRNEAVSGTLFAPPSRRRTYRGRGAGRE